MPFAPNNITALRAYGALNSSFLGTGAPAGPSSTLAGPNAMLEIHEDNPQSVLLRYAARSGMVRLPFQFLEAPITEDHSPNYESLQVMGRSENYMLYSGTENRKIPLRLAFAASVNQADRGEMDTAIRCGRWVQSLAMPHYLSNDDLMYPPALCRLVLGRFITARVVLTGFSMEHDVPFVGEHSHFEYPYIVRLTCEFTVVNTKPLSASDFIPVMGERVKPAIGEAYGL